MEHMVKTSILKCYYSIIKQIEVYLTTQNLDNLQCEFKEGTNGSKEIVTKIDREIEEICIDNLNFHFRKFSIIAEESYNSKVSILKSESFFVIDPVDGTAELLRGGTDWSISIAAISNNETQVAILYFPKKAIHLSGIKGEGIWLNYERIKPKTEDNTFKIGISPRQNIVSVFIESLEKRNWQFVEIPHFTPKILAIILGQINAATYLPQHNKGTKLWDYAAASLIINEFGGKLTSLSNQKLDLSGKKIFHKEGWLATDEHCDHKNLIKFISSIHLG